MSDHAKPKSKRGGKRAGSGRKPRAVKHSGPIAACEQRISDKLPKLIDNLFVLADGGFERCEQKFESQIRTIPGVDGSPDTFESVLVLIEQKTSRAEPCRESNKYLIDRILGRPKQAIELEVDDRRDTTLAALKEIVERGRKKS